jgi:hypothetical protein
LRHDDTRFMANEFSDEVPTGTLTRAQWSDAERAHMERAAYLANMREEREERDNANRAAWLARKSA